MAETGRGKWLQGERDHRAAKTRELISRLPHKVIWGTDMLPTDRLYQTWSLFLRTTRKDIDYTYASFYPGQGDWLVDGLGLGQKELEKFCRDVAKGLLGLD